MMRCILLAAVSLLCLPTLTASTWEGDWRKPGRAAGLGFTEEVERVSVAYEFESFFDAVPAQIGDKKRETTDEMFGAGASLGINYAAIGIGFGFWFEYYPLPCLALGPHMTVAYGFLGSPYESDGDGLAFSLQFGGRFVLDFDSIEITRWLRPFVAFYPIGLAYFSGTEEFDVPGTGNTDEITYSDVFFIMSGGFGVDFFVTPNIGVGVALYIYGTVGGSRHDKRGFELETEGSAGVYFEWARLSIRF